MPDITLDSKFKTSNKTEAFVQIKNDAKNIQNDVVLLCVLKKNVGYPDIRLYRQKPGACHF